MSFEAVREVAPSDRDFELFRMCRGRAVNSQVRKTPIIWALIAGPPRGPSTQICIYE